MAKRRYSLVNSVSSIVSTIFCTIAIHDQKVIWNHISQNINNDHQNFTPTKRQCRNKWNALKSGYENLKRLLSGNLEGFPTHTPTLHDERFHDELSDEFWLAESNNLLFICANLRNLPIINYVAQYRLKSIKTVPT